MTVKERNEMTIYEHIYQKAHKLCIAVEKAIGSIFKQYGIKSKPRNTPFQRRSHLLRSRFPIISHA